MAVGLLKHREAARLKREREGHWLGERKGDGVIREAVRLGTGREVKRLGREQQGIGGRKVREGKGEGGRKGKGVRKVREGESSKKEGVRKIPSLLRLFWTCTVYHALLA